MVGNNPPVLLPIQRRVEVEERDGGVKNPAYPVQDLSI
jgi:hypothetical protein